MRFQSTNGGRHELGQNFLRNPNTINRFVAVVRETEGGILEIGAGDGAITRKLSLLGRELTAIDVDERYVKRLRQNFSTIRVERADALRFTLEFPVIVGNIPFSLTTPILRRLLKASSWHDAVLLTQWEVARKRAGIGGRTMMTAQAAPWYVFELCGRVPAQHFTPQPSVDGGILHVTRRERPLVPSKERRGYENFVYATFTGKGRTLAQVITQSTGAPSNDVSRALSDLSLTAIRLPRDLDVEAWVSLWSRLARNRPR
ncbi:23S ribosomal RNA methyltransferase Erm [Arthrobacter luteolus]|uniref:23S ribosomal RNA methyltransferase Erm n=1 Tax=Arthrobacter luteolus TaxID=98672 RepID=UPI0009F8F2C6|nr:23S ribosomal RNA methyltransferase Erm [Arthrobacter luteolus]